MPRGDRTGPEGMGPMTGHAAGYCAGYDEPGFTDAPVGRAHMGRGYFGRGRRWAPRGRGRGRGLFFRRRFVGPAAGWAPVPTWTAEDERQALTEEARGLEAALENIKARLAQMEDDAE